MRRRGFISNLFLFISAWGIFPKRALSALLKSETPQFSSHFDLRIVSKLQNINSKISQLVYKNTAYFALNNLARIMRFGTFTNDDRRKTVLYLEKNRFTFTADNNFVIINDHVVQLPHACYWHEDKLWVPVDDVVHILNSYSALTLTMSADKKVLSLDRSDINVTGVRIAPKQNGTLIQVYSLREFSDKEIVLDIRNGWFHIDIYGAKIDTAAISAIPGAGIISKVEGIQLGETASIAFKLKRGIESRELIHGKDNNDFYVNLRTTEDIPEQGQNEKVDKNLQKQKERWKIDTIVLDAGHGGKDPGAVGYNKLYEKNVVLPVTLALGAEIKKRLPNVKIVYTRKTDVFIPLWKRTKIANEADGKLFISIHCNSSTSRKANGFETYFLSADKDKKAKNVVLKENAVIDFEESHDRKRYEGVNFILATMAQSAFIKQSEKLAATVQSSLRSKLQPVGMNSRGVKQGPFWVMVGATMPNILIETGYISNKFESRILKKKTTQKKIAAAVCDAIVKFKKDMERVS